MLAICSFSLCAFSGLYVFVLGSVSIGDYENLIDTGFVCSQEKGVTYTVLTMMYANNQFKNNRGVVRTLYGGQSTQLSSLNRADQLIFALLLGGVPKFQKL